MSHYRHRISEGGQEIYCNYFGYCVGGSFNWNALHRK